MIDLLIGKVYRKNAGSTTILINGVGYEVFIPFCYYNTYQQDDEITVDIVHIQKEDGRETLYGFFDYRSKTFFKSLLTVDGIGDKKAFSMMMDKRPQELMEMVINKDLNAFKKVKGIGPKTAQKIIETLEGKIEVKEIDVVLTSARSGLEHMGLTTKEIDSFIDGLDKNKTYRIDELMTMALTQ
jgi:Holliday junction DNA helicase RuvA